MGTFLKFLGLVLIVASFSTPPARAERPCAQYSGTQKDSCLKAEIRRGEAELRRINRENLRRDRQIKAVERANRATRRVVEEAGTVYGTTRGMAAGGVIGAGAGAAAGREVSGRAYDATNRAGEAAYKKYKKMKKKRMNNRDR